MIEVTSGAYWENLRAFAPKPFRARTCLYVGAHVGGGLSFVPEILLSGYKLTIVDAHEPNIIDLRENYPGWADYHHADIRDFETRRSYDLVMWWHGPEHLPREDVDVAISFLKGLALVDFIVGAPNGTHSHGEDSENPHEKHLCALYKEDFQKWGLCVKDIGEPDVVGSQLMGWSTVNA